MRLFLSAGEASGDAYAAAIIDGCNSAGFDFDFCAIGGALCRQRKVKLVCDSSRWGAIGILEAARVFFRVSFGFRRACKELRTGQPGIAIPVDFGFFNIRLARQAKAAGWKVLYFIPPGSWRRDRQASDLKEVADVVVTPFPWSQELLAKNGVTAHWFGHPLLELVDRARSSQKRPERSSFAILPGSRKHEIQNNLQCLAVATANLVEPIEFAVATTTTCETVRAAWLRAGGRPDGLIFTQFDTAGVLLRAKAAAVCSGTATLEAALCHCPMVVVYRGSKLMEIEAKIRRMKVKFASLPNILLDRPLLPEFLLWFAEPIAVRDSIAELLTNPQTYSSQLRGFEEIERLLGKRDAIQQTIDLIRSLKNG